MKKLSFVFALVLIFIVPKMASAHNYWSDCVHGGHFVQHHLGGYCEQDEATSTPPVDEGTTTPPTDTGTTTPPVDEGTTTPPVIDEGTTTPPVIEEGTSTPPVETPPAVTASDTSSSGGGGGSMGGHRHCVMTTSGNWCPPGVTGSTGPNWSDLANALGSLANVLKHIMPVPIFEGKG